ncbi:efflux RND transporter permease subunit [Cohnella zeiphila]|uniref:Efflux RND transporter permease subunit n=1 Tax=Cohnella zeiphila TaxID=2761120 RepID=A0A7X0VWL2_9BACL|nr:efflux RND transporter permease subunit [Cohnella zeiphila]MBB6733086.1 efflux RND transporter permease subunit [Cohnella zeiphila]
MHRLIEAAKKRTVLILISLAVILVWGGASAYRMQRDYLPSISNPTLMITVQAQHDRADQIRTSVAGPIEQAVRGVRELQSMETNSFEGGLLLSLAFPLNYDMDRAEREVADALLPVSLPEEVGRPTVTRVSTGSFPMMRLTLTSPSGQVDENTLRTAVQARVSDEVLHAPGVGEVRVTGAAKNGYVLTIRMDDLIKAGLTIDDVKRALAGFSFPSVQGNLTDSQMSVPLEASGWAPEVADLERLSVRGADGSSVPLSSVADVSKSLVDLQTISRTDGAASVVLDVLKKPSANITEVSKNVRDRISDVSLALPGDAKLAIAYDQGKEVQSSLNGLLREGLLGCLFSMVSVWLFFRNTRSTLLIALSLPICILATAGLLGAMGFSLNLLTVSGLVVAMGRVIDDTIVILDNAHRKLQQSGRPFLSSALMAEAAGEMLPAIVSSTATTVAVFIPIALVGGMIGAAFSGFAWSVVLSLLISLLVAAVIVPVLYYAWQRGRPGAAAVSVEPFSERLLQWAIPHKGKWIAGFAALLLAAVAGALLLPINFLPAQTSGQINVQLEYPERTTLAQIDASVKRMEQALKADPGVETFSSVLGSSFTPQFDDVFDAGGGWIQGGNIANIAVSVREDEDVDAVTDRLKDRLVSLSDSAVVTVTNQNISGDDSQLRIDLTGADEATLAQAAALVRNGLKDIPNLSVMGEADDEAGAPGYRVALDRAKLEQAGVQPDQVLERVRNYLSGGTRVEVNAGDRTTVPLEIRTKLPAMPEDASGLQLPETEALALLGRETFRGKDGKDVPLEQLATLTRDDRPSVLRERDGTPFAVVTANMTSRDIEGVAQEVRKQLSRLTLPAGVRYSTNGITAQVEQMIWEMGIAISVSVILILLILSMMFRGWRAPLVVLCCIPFAFIGSVAGMLLAGGEWNLATLVGLLMLTGIAATNGIVLVDRVERRLASGMPPREAILTGAASRVRPVLMTAVTTVLTLLPLCFSSDGDTVISRSLGIVVVCGMISSTLISLLVIPLLYDWLLVRGSRPVTVGRPAGKLLETP